MANKFGFWTLTFLVIANMIGAGVFTTSGYTLADLNSSSLVLWGWAVGGAIACAGAYSYGMLVQAMPESGGEYLFLSRAAHPLFGFLAGWVSLIAGFSGAIAFSATAFEKYLIPETSRPDWLPAGAVATVAIVIGALAHGFKPQAGAIIQNCIVAIKLILLGTFILFAAAKLPTHAWHWQPVAPTEGSNLSIAVAFDANLVWISLSYSGFNAAVYLAGEVKDAKSTVPPALVVGTVIVTLLYLGLNAIFISAAPAEQILEAPDIAAIAANSLGGPKLETFIRLTIAACLLTSVLSMMLAAPRVYAKMADDGLMPPLLRFQGESPRFATLAQAAVALFFVYATTIQWLISYLGLTLSISAACSVFCLFLPNVRAKKLLHPIHIIPAFYITCTAITALMLTLREPLQLAGVAITFLVGVIAYWATRS